jgi:hypothetical protein
MSVCAPPGCRGFDGSFLSIRGHDTQGYKHAKKTQHGLTLLAERAVRHWTFGLEILACGPIPEGVACGTFVRPTVSDIVDAHY